jgi:hypothetical protein
MGARILVILGLALLLGMAQAFAQPGTSAPDAEYGKKLAGNLCSNCHLVGTGEQQQANADVPSFPEIANKEGQTCRLDHGAYRATQAPNAHHPADPERTCRPRGLYSHPARVEVALAAHTLTVSEL